MGENLFDLSGKTALVTGASDGIGAHFARLLAAHGARVALTARRVERLREIAGDINRQGGEAVAAAMDVRDGASVEDAVAGLWGDFGAVNVLVNNAGIAAGGAAVDVAEAEWDAVVDTNLKGAFLVAQNVARRLAAAGGGGSFVNITSILGERAAGNVAAYAASKAALAHLTRVLALEWARHGIRVNAIAPGYIGTAMNRKFFATEAGRNTIKKIPQRRIGEPRDLDGALLLLASDASSYMTGGTIVVDGGHLQSSL